MSAFSWCNDIPTKHAFLYCSNNKQTGVFASKSILTPTFLPAPQLASQQWSRVLTAIGIFKELLLVSQPGSHEGRRVGTIRLQTTSFLFGFTRGNGEA